MVRHHGQAYEDYRARAPFMFPIPKIFARLISAPFRLLLHKERPENRWDLVWTFGIYLGLIILLSLPFVLSGWPVEGWMNWPFQHGI